MSVQAQQLANALTVSSKSTGDWGETILEKILEDSGLRKGHEYDLQVSISGRKGESLRPDAVINLPESRQLVVDSKVSNKAWTEYCAATDEAEKAAKLREHLASLRAHIKDLSAKGYTDSPELSTVDFVLMFVPVEAALLTAFVKDPDLYADAYRARIVLVAPSTLMAVIKLVRGHLDLPEAQGIGRRDRRGRPQAVREAHQLRRILHQGRRHDQAGPRRLRGGAEAARHRQGKCHQAGGEHQAAGRDAGIRQADAGRAAATGPGRG